MIDRALLVLDLDETLIYATLERLDRDPDFCCGEYYVYERSHLKSFLLACSHIFDLAIWSSGSCDYVQAIIDRIIPLPISLAFVWDCARCTRSIHPETGQMVCIKDLKKLKRKGYSLGRILIVENDPGAVQRNYGNAIYVKDFYGEPDDELLFLSKYLRTLAHVPDMRRIEKRLWRGRAT